MKKWYDNEKADAGNIISTRIRLARNLQKYPFSAKLSDMQARSLMKDVKEAIINERNPLASVFRFIEVDALAAAQKECMIETHSLSPVLAAKRQPCGVLLQEDETVSIMINEEDHIRIQVVMPGDGMDAAWDMADKMDSLLEENLTYAFDNEFGYLTSCPTNVGTGLRASYMVHLPALEKTGQIGRMIQEVAKFGVTIRGTYGEGSDAIGAMYQISNQVTLGRSEQEILRNLRNVLNTILVQENKIKDKLIAEHKEEMEDMAGRAYGSLSYAHILTAKEATEHLSNVLMGFHWGLLKEKKPKQTICSLLIGIQPGNLQTKAQDTLSPHKRDCLRATYLREQFR